VAPTEFIATLVWKLFV